MSWTRALHFKSWADTRDAQHLLPLLVRRLIRAVTERDATVNFPAFEQVQRPGPDGIVNQATGNQFVPSGKSVWEMGVNRDAKAKADEDFDNRTSRTPAEDRRELTFVFVTPREWRTKDEWAKEKKNNSHWKDVIVLDANDLEHWIELAPNVDVWFSTASGRRPSGLVDLAARWTALSRIAERPLSREVVLTSREQIITELSSWLSSEPSSLLLKGESVADGLDFLSALATANLTDAPNLERMFVVDNIDVWRVMAPSRESLILVAPASVPLNAEDIVEAVLAGHHVLITGSRSASTTARSLCLPRQDAYAVTTELEHCGFDVSKARSLARGSCGSFSVLKRLLTEHPQTAFPEWSNEANRAALAPFALIGGWMHVDSRPVDDPLFHLAKPIDLDFLEEFLGVTRESLEAIVSRWTMCDSPLFLRFRDNIVINSREDAWYLLGSAITPQMLGRFEELALLVLEEDDPALDLPSEDRWTANIRGKTHSISGELRQGVLESLALLAVYPTAGRPALNVDFRAAVRRILARVLPAGASWKRWATFGRQLSLFAEADPDYLLCRIEEDLMSDSPHIPMLFKNGGTGLSSSSLHCGLLWALEIMAWSGANLQ